MNNDINKNELYNQIVKAIKESEHYVEYNVIIGKDDNQILPHIKSENCNIDQIAKLIVTLENSAKLLKASNPLAAFLSLSYEVEIDIISSENSEGEN